MTRSTRAAFLSGLAVLAVAVVGFTAMSLTYPNALAQAREVKRRLGDRCRTVLGGPHATLFPRESVAAGFDAAVMGDGELSFPRPSPGSRTSTPCRSPTARGWTRCRPTWR